MLPQKLIFLILLFTGACAFAQTGSSEKDKSSGGANTPTFKLSGDARLSSHYVYRGLSYTDKDPGMNASFFFNLGPQFKFGFTGSNVKFEGVDDTHFWLNFRGEVKVDFNPDFIARLYYTDHRYYRSSLRNGTSLGTTMTIYGVKAQFEMDSNWEGSQTRDQYLASGYDFKLPADFILGTHLGYSMLTTDTNSNFFDVRVGLIYKTLNAGTWDVSVTSTSGQSQLNGRGDTFAILSAFFEF